MTAQPTPQTPDISVCICTFRRPEQLQALLTRLGQQQPVPGLPHCEIVVVDNDPAHSARPVLQTLATQLPLRYVHLPQANISAARNAAIRLAQGQWLAWIDDDELPEPNWLFELAQTQRTHAADVVFAPVLPVYPAQISPWLRTGGYYERPRFATGTVIGISDARSGNVWIRAQALADLPGPFDTAFGTTGGEDSLLFRQLQARGLKFIWCDSAPVHEALPPDRAQPRWLLQRSYRVGQIWMRCELHALQGASRIRRAWGLGLRAGVQLGVALVLAGLCWPLSRTRGFHWLRTAWAQVGKLSALFGQRQHAYGQ